MGNHDGSQGGFFHLQLYSNLSFYTAEGNTLYDVSG